MPPKKIKQQIQDNESEKDKKKEIKPIKIKSNKINKKNKDTEIKDTEIKDTEIKDTENNDKENKKIKIKDKEIKEIEDKEIKPIKITLNDKGKILVIVESPGKIKKIQSILGDNYIVTASVGHIIDLASKNMSIDIDNDFKPKYYALEGKNKIINDLKKIAKECSDILLATDEDREGEMIAWSIAYVLGLNNSKRITFNSITEQEIKNAIKNPKDICLNLVDAQKSRRILDRIVGYEISPILWKSIGQSLSAGRVQSVVVKIILDREKEINEFLLKDIESEFKFKALFNTNIVAQLYQIKKPNVDINHDLDEILDENSDENVDLDENGKLINGYKSYIPKEKNAKEILNKIIESEFKISGTGNKTQIRNSSPPFTTSTLQQEASRKLGFTIKRTMMSAQNLYEAGHITYMRTDSINLSKEASNSIEKYIKSTYGNQYYNKKEYKTPKNTQEAHECIRPTHIEISGLNETGKISSDEVKLYILIWKRTIASQMSPAKILISSAQISISKLKEYYFQSELSSIIFDGFLKVYNLQNLEETEEKILTKIPKLNEKLKLTEINVKQEYQKSPPRYNEASLVNKLDPKNLNIGRPSTYAAIITKIQERGYVEKLDNNGIEKNSKEFKWNFKDNEIEEQNNKIIVGKDTGKLCPTATGKLVTEFLTEYFKELMDYKFTSNMEKKLDEIAEGKLNISKLLNDFYFKEFHPIIEKLSKENIKYNDKDKRILGNDENGNTIIASVKRYGPVVFSEKNDKVINVAPIKHPNKLETITLEKALELLSYPKILGKIGKSEVKLNRGKYGLYVKFGDKNINLSGIDEETITIDLINEKLSEIKNKNLWEGKDGKVNYVILNGPYGKYINIKDLSKKTNKPFNVKLAEDVKIEELTLEKVKELVKDGKINKFKKKFTPNKNIAKD
jgi:DNA topoisomerase-1